MLFWSISISSFWVSTYVMECGRIFHANDSSFHWWFCMTERERENFQSSGVNHQAERSECMKEFSLFIAESSRARTHILNHQQRKLSHEWITNCIASSESDLWAAMKVFHWCKIFLQLTLMYTTTMWDVDDDSTLKSGRRGKNEAAEN